MKIGIGLPSTIPWAKPQEILEWARRADEAGFSTLGTIDRLVYGNYETVPALAAAAAVTERIRLTTSILLTPFRGKGDLLAKQLATIDLLSGGRLTVGVAAGSREDDYTAEGIDFDARGHVLDEQLMEMREVWNGAPRGMWGPIGPAPAQPGGPELLIGGTSDAAIRRTVEHGAGWVAGGGGPARFAEAATKVRAAWREAGREGEPRLASLMYYALGPHAEDDARRYLTDYYGFLGDWVQAMVASTPKTPEGIAEAVAAFVDAGCDELILFPSSPDPEQVARLAEVVPNLSPA